MKASARDPAKLGIVPLALAELRGIMSGHGGVTAAGGSSNPLRRLVARDGSCVATSRFFVHHVPGFLGVALELDYHGMGCT